MTPTHLALAGVVFFAAHMISTTSGFGANVLGVPLLALLVGVEPAKQSLVVLGVLMYVYLTLRWRGQIDRRELLFIAVVTGVGLIAGIIIASQLNARASAILLATFVIVVGLRGLLNVAPDVSAPKWLRQAMLILGGVVHGAFTTGGPLIVIYAHRALPDRSTFRSTLAVMWLLLGIGLMAGWTLRHAWDPATLRLSMIGLPFMIAGLASGEYLHHKVDERRFRSLVNLTLVAVGVVLAWTTLAQR